MCSIENNIEKGKFWVNISSLSGRNVMTMTE